MPRIITTRQLREACGRDECGRLDEQGLHVIESAAETGRGTRLCKALLKVVSSDDPVPAWLELPEEMFVTLKAVELTVPEGPSWEGQP